jgi:hypothetical protein
MKLTPRTKLLVALSALTTLISLTIIVVMAFNPGALLPKDLGTSDGAIFIAAFVLARTLPLSAAFFWLLWRRDYRALRLLVWLLAFVQAGDACISLAYGAIGSAIGPVVSALIYALAARSLAYTAQNAR